ncbi:MAG: phytoene desaturase family protein [Parvibaculaceae bacterium]
MAPLVKKYDVVIVGGGHNGLVCSAYLAKAGLSVCVLERRHIVGGAAVTEEVWPDHHVSVASYGMTLFQPRIIEELELGKHGLEVLRPDPVFLPFPDGRWFVFADEPRQFYDQLAKFSKKDAAAYPQFRKRLDEIGPLLRRLIWETPPNLSLSSAGEALDFLKFALKHRDLRFHWSTLYDLLTLSLDEYLSRWFESAEVKAALCGLGGNGGNAGPRTPGTASCLMRPLMKEPDSAATTTGFVRGGMGMVTRAIADSARASGVEIRTDARVIRIKLAGPKATGVVLTSGEEVDAALVVSNANLKTTFLKLLDATQIEPEFLRSVKGFRTIGSVYKINLATEDVPHYRMFSPDLAGFGYPTQVQIGPSVDYLQKSFEDGQNQRCAAKPFLFCVTPSITDRTLSPQGSHIINVLAGHTSHEVEKLSREQHRETLLKAVVGTLNEYTGARFEPTHSQVLTPLDLEEIFDLPGGHVHHGELTVDQMFVKRPVAGYSDYRTPIEGLYLASASVHPGGGVTGVPGFNAAKAILRRKRRS